MVSLAAPFSHNQGEASWTRASN